MGKKKAAGRAKADAAEAKGPPRGRARPADSTKPEAAAPGVSVAAVELTDIARVDLARHAVIEASAGTGKTYTIEHLVLRLLLETDTELEQILLVTYTEKATGELRDRVRRRIEAALAAGGLADEVASRLRRAVDGFDRASIHTIHGFCNRLLSQHAFENGQPLSLDLVDDAELVFEILREHQRARWPMLFGADLALQLRLAGYPGDAFDESSWERKVCRLAASFDPDAGDVLVPDGSRAPDARAAAVEAHDAVREFARIAGAKKFLGRLVPSLKKNRVDSAMARIFTPIEKLAEVDDPAACMLEVVDRSLGSYGGGYLAGCVYQDDLDGLPEVAALDEQLDRIAAAMAGTTQAFLAFSARQLRDDLDRHKRERGLVSYHDMLSRVRDAALREDSLLMEALADRYRVALVDEFQDTDAIQWDIFRRMFVQVPGRRLFVIGDPKQAIYGFRGADVHAYVRARDAMISAAEAERYALPVNWRSSAALIEALNHLFDAGRWFDGADGIIYDRVRAAPPGKLRCTVARDETGRAAATFVELPKDAFGGIARARAEYARFVVREILSLLGRAPGDSGARLVLDRGASAVQLTERDICILVRSRSEAAVFEEALRGARVAHSFYKKDGIWDSEEATHLAYVLEAVRDPADPQALKRALMTRIFAVRPEELAAYALAPPSHPARALLARWRADALARRWSAMFASILEDSGVLFRDLESGEAERRRTNYLHVIQALEDEAYARNLDIVEVCRTFGRYRTSGGDDVEDGDLHRIETERPSVQIMTMHAAKGLEFPVVFLGGLRAAPARSDWYQYHDGPHRVFDLLKGDDGKARDRQEREREDRRLLYVALTRSMQKLYVPVWVEPPPKSGRSTAAKTMAKIVHEAVAASWEAPPKPEVAARIVLLPGGREFARDAYLSTLGSDERPIYEDVALPLAQVPPAASPIPVPAAYLPPSPPSPWSRMQRVYSYSSLVSHGAPPATARASFGDRAPRDDDDVPVESPPAAEALPAGAETGSMLHMVLENVEFAAGAAESPEAMRSRPGVDETIDEALAYHLPALRGRPDAVAETARIVWSALHVPLGAAGCRLCDVGPTRRRSEVEFHMPAAPPAGGGELPGVEIVTTDRGPLVHGYIDLVFEAGGRCYILDWKSNRLEGYAPAELERDMLARGYDLQYALYSVALARWMARGAPAGTGPGALLGGVYYVYLRGVDGNDEERGIYHRPIAPGDLAAFERDLGARVGLGPEGLR